MIGIDTNIIVRLLTNDDEIQAAQAAKIITNDDIYISKTVLMETEWVLRYAYKLDRVSILQSFKKLLGLPNILVEQPTTIREAINWYEQGADFADALHVASNGTVDTFVTFDQKLAKKIAPLTTTEIQLLQ